MDPFPSKFCEEVWLNDMSCILDCQHLSDGRNLETFVRWFKYKVIRHMMWLIDIVWSTIALLSLNRWTCLATETVSEFLFRPWKCCLEWSFYSTKSWSKKKKKENFAISNWTNGNDWLSTSSLLYRVCNSWFINTRYSKYGSEINWKDSLDQKISPFPLQTKMRLLRS